MTTGRWLFSVAMLIIPGVVFAQDAPTSGTIRVDKPLMPRVIFAPEPSAGVTETSPRFLKRQKAGAASRPILPVSCQIRD